LREGFDAFLSAGWATIDISQAMDNRLRVGLTRWVAATGTLGLGKDLIDCLSKIHLEPQNDLARFDATWVRGDEIANLGVNQLAPSPSAKNAVVACAHGDMVLLERWGKIGC
jgi:hypothetical protein